MVKSRTELIRIKDEIEFLRESKEIFEEKRNVLLKEIFKILDEIEEKRKNLNGKVLEGYKVLSKALMEVGKEKLMERSSNVELQLEVEEKVFAGIVVPKVDFKFERKVEVVVEEGIFAKVTEKTFQDILNLILEIAELEMKGWKLVEEIKKTTVRINAIENFYLPSAKMEAKKLKEYLEETERTENAILRKWKSYFG